MLDCWALEELPGARGELTPGFPVGWLLGEPVYAPEAVKQHLGRVKIFAKAGRPEALPAAGRRPRQPTLSA